MKVVAYSSLHYGLDVARESIRSVYDAVDEFHFLYSARPTFGFDTTAVNPDHAADLIDATKQAAGSKWRWYTGSPNQWRSEGEHCDYRFVAAPDADVYVRLDTDELWTDGLLAAAIQHAVKENVCKVRVPFVHLWRSFYRGMPNDPLLPDRIHYVHGDPKRESTFREAGNVIHAGYAQRGEVVEYKAEITAHRNEWRPDWLESKWRANAQEDVHPTMHGWWNVESIDPFALGMPAYMSEHPYSKLDFIP